MKKTYSIFGAIFTIIVGSILHFTFEWSKFNKLVGLFSAVNESTWEHLKLLAIPMIVYFVFEYFKYGKKHDNFIQVKFLSIIIGMFLIVSMYYTYKGIIGKHFVVVDILIFIIATIIAYYFSYKMIGKDFLVGHKVKVISLIGIIGIVVLLSVFTFYPPHINLFKDVSGFYGIRK